MEIITPNMDYLAIQNSLHLAGVDLTDKRKVLGAALGAALSRSLAIPPTEVNSAEIHYTQNLAIDTIAKIGEVNEKVILDTFFAKQYAKSLYLVRYNAAYPKPSIAVVSPYDFFCTYSSVHMYFSPEDYEFFQKYKTQILLLSNQFGNLLCK